MNIWCELTDHDWKAIKTKHGFAWECKRCRALDENED